MEINKIHNIDFLQGVELIKDNSIDLIVTDPPYTMTKRGKSCRPNWMPNNMGENVFNGEIPDIKEWMNECYRVLKEETHFYTFVNINDITNFLLRGDNMGEIYKWCPSCNNEETVEEKEPKTIYGGTDGYGQPVRFSECECGKVYGWFNIGLYRGKDGFEFEDSFKSYLKHRIKHYYRG